VWALSSNSSAHYPHYVQVQVKNFVVPPLLKEHRCITIVTNNITCSQTPEKSRKFSVSPRKQQCKFCPGCRRGERSTRTDTSFHYFRNRLTNANHQSPNQLIKSVSSKYKPVAEGIKFVLLVSLSLLISLLYMVLETSIQVYRYVKVINLFTCLGVLNLSSYTVVYFQWICLVPTFHGEDAWLVNEMHSVMM